MWKKIGGIVLLVLAFVGRLGDLDFVVTRIQDPGWVGAVLRFTLDTPLIWTALAIAGGISLILWGNRSGRRANAGPRAPTAISHAPVPTVDAELDQIRRDVGWLAEALTSYAPYDQQEESAIERYRRLFDSDHTIWLDPSLKQLRRDFLNRCGIAMSCKKQHFSKEEDKVLRQEISEFAKELDKLVTQGDQQKMAPHKDPIEEIAYLYPQAVELRNHAASLRVLDAETQSKMDELQHQLLERVRKIAPRQAINLATLNTYDPRNHPRMALQDPKRTLEFSEFLRRVMTILESH